MSLVTLHLSARALKPGDVIDIIDAKSADQLPLAFWAEECDCPFYLHAGVCVCVCVCVCAGVDERVCLCVCARARVSVCVCVCVGG